MIKSKLTLLLCLLTSTLCAQIKEEISPLGLNLELQKQNQKSFPGIYVYEIDTLDLPILDEFSTNKFRKYNAKPTDPNVSSSEFFQLMNGATPFPADTGFSLTQTFSILYDTLPDGTDTAYFTPLPSAIITVNDLTQYPIIGTSTTIYPCYNIVDTAYLPSSPDTLYPATCEIVQDSVDVYFVSAIDQSTAIWLDGYAYHNYRYPVAPPTLGVATFDGLDETGYPYDFTLPTAYGYADYLTSKPIDLSAYPLSDSIYLSFFYQPMGRGEAPDDEDSLVLEFFSPLTVAWEHAWSVSGDDAIIEAPAFKQVMVPLLKTTYLSNAFQFRFKNYGSTSGSIDHWNIDYVYLNRFRSNSDTIRDDVAFVYQGTTLLNNNYTSMPISHYEVNPKGFMRDTVSVFQRNNNISGRIIGFNNMKVGNEGINLFTVNNPSTPSITGRTNFKTLFDVDNASVWYDTSVVDSCAEVFDVMFYHNTTPDDCRDNDTMRFSQMFSNYYAYDDGTAEAAYGPIGAGAKLAYAYTLQKPDDMYGIAIHFSPTVNNLDNKTFFLTIWDNTGSGGTPGNIIYQETVLSDVIYGNATNKFTVYPFSTPLSVSGTIYIGWQQVSADKLNVGFDYNTNSKANIYFNVGSSWINTSFTGSIMMRPVFNSCETDIVSVVENKTNNNSVQLYPNPASTYVNIQCDHKVNSIQVFDVTGKNMGSYSYTNGFDVSGWVKGLYLVNVNTDNGISSHRLLVE